MGWGITVLAGGRLLHILKKEVGCLVPCPVLCTSKRSRPWHSSHGTRCLHAVRVTLHSIPTAFAARSLHFLWYEAPSKAAINYSQGEIRCRRREREEEIWSQVMNTNPSMHKFGTHISDMNINEGMTLIAYTKEASAFSRGQSQPTSN